MNLKNTDKTVFSYKTLRLIMMGFGSFMISVGSMYAYFIITTVGISNLGEVLWPLVCAIIAVPAGIYICIVGKKLKKPIIKNKDNSV